MYKVKRKERFVEQFQVEDADGKTLTLEVDIALDKQFNDFQKVWREVEVNNYKVQRGDTLDYQSLGNAVINLLTVVFGQSNAKKLIEFYNDNYIELIEDTLPFIADVIKPQFEKELKNRKKRQKESLKKLR